MTNPITNADHLNGGRWLPASFRPSEDNPLSTPASERVFVREPALAKLPELMALVGDIPAYVAFLIGKPREWVDTLTDESLYAIYDTGRALNDPRFDRWIARQIQTVEMVTPLRDKMSAWMKSVPTPPSPSASPPGTSGGA